MKIQECILVLLLDNELKGLPSFQNNISSYTGYFATILASINVFGVGGAGGNFNQVLLGAALIGASFMFPGGGMFSYYSYSGVAAQTAGVGAFLTKVGTITSVIGASLVLNGISQMLTPVETIPESSQDPRRSFNFSGIQNTSKAGVAVPVIYGRTMTGSVVISANITNEQVEV